MNAQELLNVKAKALTEILNDIVDGHGTNFDLCSRVVTNALKNGNTIFWCGNGGSAAESSHLAAELIGRFKNNRHPLRSLALNTDLAAITCIANDFGYEQIFSRQLQGLGKEGDILIVLSTSGESANILAALRMAKNLDMTSIALLGKNGGSAINLSDFSILVKSFETARIQEIHLLLGHTICEFVEIELGIA